MLVDGGYREDRVAVLAGGIDAWEQAGYPVVRVPDAT
jgi:rhodanese-related sulfurtransferase